jgi:hypothetical protein
MADIPANIKNAVRDIHWMARRYADGRCSYAPGMFNGRVRDLMAAGFELGQPLFARDGMGRAFDGLTEEEVAGAEEDMPRMHTKAFDIAEDRMNAVWDQAVEACIKAICEDCAEGKPIGYGYTHKRLTLTKDVYEVNCPAETIHILKRSQSEEDNDAK